MRLKQISVVTVALSLLLYSVSSLSKSDPIKAEPAEIISGITEEVMKIVSEATEYFEEDADRYYQAIDKVLADAVDWRGFATGVMGRYASNSRYKSLDSEGQKQLRAQRDRFTLVLREVLIRSYAKGLLAFGGVEMQIEGVDTDPDRPSLATVTQSVHGEAGKVYMIRYRMGQYKDGVWRLRNLIIQNISLGEIYRNQFAELASNAKGDLDTVINEWNAVIEEETRELASD